MRDIPEMDREHQHLQQHGDICYYHSFEGKGHFHPLQAEPGMVNSCILSETQASEHVSKNVEL